VKNRSILFLILWTLLGFVACKNDAKKEVAAQNDAPDGVFKVDAPPIRGPETVAEIDELVKGIDAQKDSLRVAGPNYVFAGKEKTEVMAYSDALAPQLIYCKTALLESWYYLVDRRPVFLKEISLTDKGFVQNRFYYGTKKLIRAETRSGPSPDATNNGAPRNFRGDKDDLRLSGEAVTGKVLEYLYGKK